MRLPTFWNHAFERIQEKQESILLSDTRPNKHSEQDDDMKLSHPALGAGAGQKATNLSCAIAILVRPNHRRPITIRPRHQGRIRHHDPFTLDSHPIAAVLSVPIDILDTDAIGERTTHALAAGELIEPLMQRGILSGVVAIITRGHSARKEHIHAQRYYRQSKSGKSVHSGLQLIGRCGLLTHGPADLENSIHMI